MRRDALWFRWMWVCVIVALWVAGAALAKDGQAGLDNDSSQSDLETYSEDETLPAGVLEARDLDGDGDFDALRVGTMGGGNIFGWAEFDGHPESELVVSAPTVAAGTVVQADADGDGDIEVIWVGTQGTDWNQDGTVALEESGWVAAVADFDGDGDVEILAVDTTQPLGQVQIQAFGWDANAQDPLDVLWVGMANDTLSGFAGTLESLDNLDGDADIEITLKDTRLRGNATPRLPQVLDIDDDGDPDVVIE